MYNKQLFYRGLDQIPIYIEDTLPNSPYYFNIVDIPKVFGPGKNSLRFNLNENNIDIYNDVSIEIIDSYGNTVYHETPEYSQPDENGIRVLTIYIYNNIVNGPLKITFVGYAKLDYNGLPIPEEFKNRFNIRYSTIVDFNRFQKNTSRILFAEKPTISITEARMAYVSKSLSTPTTVTVSGTGTYRYQHTYPILEIPVGSTFNNDMLNGVIHMTGTDFSPTFDGYVTSSYNTFTASIVNFINSRTAQLSRPWQASISNLGSNPINALVSSATISAYDLTYNPTQTDTATENYKSFINLKISNLDPASGYLNKLKLYSKSQGSLDQYEIVGESSITNNELLINTASLQQYDRKNVGYFLDNSTFTNFWSYDAGLLTPTYDSSTLFNALQLTPIVDPATTTITFTSKVDINFQKGSPYRLFLNYKKDADFIAEVYLSGSSFTNDSAGFGERVFYLDSSLYGANYQNLPIDFLAPQTGTARLLFKIVTGSFYISDISLKSGVEQGFNPSNFNSYFPINVKSRNDILDFKVDFIDDSGQITSYEFDSSNATNVQISGSNFYLEGTDNLVPGSFNLGKTSTSGIVFNGNLSKISTYGYTAGNGFAMWSGSQTISGSVQPGSGMFIETGPPYYHSIKAAAGGKIEIVADGAVGAGGVTNATFNAYTSSTNTSISSINSSLSTATANIITLTNDIATSQTPEYYQTLFGVPCSGGDNKTYNLQIKCVSGVVSFTYVLA